MAPGLQHGFLLCKLEIKVMKNKINIRTQVSVRKGEIWNSKVGFFQPGLLTDGDIPTEVVYVNIQLLLN